MEEKLFEEMKYLISFPEFAHNCWDAVYADEKNYDWLLSFTAPQGKNTDEDPSLNCYG